MAIEPCLKNPHGKSTRHKWTPGTFRQCKCVYCGRKWTDCQIKPPPDEPTKVMVAEILEILKRSSERKAERLMLACDCCFCRWQRTNLSDTQTS